MNIKIVNRCITSDEGEALLPEDHSDNPRDIIRTLINDPFYDTEFHSEEVVESVLMKALINDSLLLYRKEPDHDWSVIKKDQAFGQTLYRIYTLEDYLSGSEQRDTLTEEQFKQQY